ncbi:MAG: AMP-dependent synthetase/ligase [Nocardioidaceae bacterium]
MVEVRELQERLADRAQTVGQMLFDRVAATPDREAYRFPAGGAWQSLTWAETGERVTRLAAGIMSLGITSEQRVAIASGTRIEWVLADLAVMTAGAATTTVYPSSVPVDVGFILSDSESCLIFAENDEQIAKINAHRDQLPALQTIVTFDGTPDEDQVISLDELERRGERLLSDAPSAVSERLKATRPDDLATLIYTSGTTGQPKGVRLLHSAWTYEGAAVEALGILTIDDVQFLWLPLSHSFGKVLLTAQLAIGFMTAVDGRVEQIIDNLGIVRPTFMGAAPRIFEKAHARISRMAAEGGGVRERIFDRAFVVGREVAQRQREGRHVSPALMLQHRVFDRLVFAKIRSRFGNRVRFFVSGAAALNRDIAEWFDAAGIVILEGYGLTETSAGSCLNRPDNNRFGTVGQPLAGTEMRVADDGELLIRGPGVMQGYHHLEPTEDLFSDGWLRTGDMAEIDDENFVRITDRKKDLFKTSGGKYVAPQIIEGQFKAVCPYVSQFVVHGDQRHFVSALVTLDPEAIEGWAVRNGLAGRSYSDIVTSSEARGMVQHYVDELNTRLNRWETIKRFVILDKDLTVDEGEVTPSLKLKRKVVEERYREHLDELYI